MSEPLAVLTDVSVKRGSFTLSVPRWEIPAGRVIGVVGANGAGKTTLLRLLPGLDAPDAGQVRVFGLDPVREPRIVRVALGWMSDDMPVFPMPIARMLRSLSGFYPSWDAELAARLMETFGLKADAQPATLSKGEGTKLRLITALAFRPKLLVLDEPATGLDVGGRRRMLEQVLEVAQDPGRTVIISSHGIADVERIADDLVVVDQGRIVRSGAVDELVDEGATLEEHLLAWGCAG